MCIHFFFAHILLKKLTASYILRGFSLSYPVYTHYLDNPGRAHPFIFHPLIVATILHLCDEFLVRQNFFPNFIASHFGNDFRNGTYHREVKEETGDTIFSPPLNYDRLSPGCSQQISPPPLPLNLRSTVQWIPEKKVQLDF